MLSTDNKNILAISGKKEIGIVPGMINRHGLITGATGTGKTVSLQTMAETFSSLGIPVFMADIKGDLSGVAKEGSVDGKAGKRIKELGLTARGYKNRAFPVCFWDVFGTNGHSLRTTISEMGPLLLAKLLNLNEVQSGLLRLIFKVADDNGLLLLDLKDLRSMTQHVGEEREKYREYGQISPASIGAIQRSLLALEEEGGDMFFGEPAMDVMDLISFRNSMGVINILDATVLVNRPALYSCVLLWLLSELFERLPEVGDLATPKLAFFFDEAHLLFDGISPALLQKIEQVTRLVRSRGVGIYFVSQNPADMPDDILGQLGNRVQHALRAFTPKDQKAVRAAALSFRANPAFSTEEAIASLGVGEALVSFMDENGAPQIVERSLIVPPEGQIGPIKQEERAEFVRTSPLYGKYDTVIDRESAYEILAARTQMMDAVRAGEQRRKDEEKTRKQAEKLRQQQEKENRRLAREQAAVAKGNQDIFSSMMNQTKRTITNSVGREIGRALIRGVLGSLIGGRR